MELYAGAALSGMGYLLNQQREVLNAQRGPNAGPANGVSPIGRPNETPSMTNMYASDHWSSVRRDEETRGQRVNRAAQAPFQTGVVPRPAYASMFSSAEEIGPAGAGMGSAMAPRPGPTMGPNGTGPGVSGPSVPMGAGMPRSAAMAAYGEMDTMGGLTGYRESVRNTANGSSGNRRPTAPVTSMLTGEAIAPEQFLPPNTQPYFRGSVRQNMDPGMNSTLLENYTGRGDLLLSKKESECFFKPTAGNGNVCGMANFNDVYQDRVEKPIRRHNDFPIEQVRVAPGVGLGFTSEGMGGFQQASTLDYIRPKTIDELRPGNKQKVVMEARVQGPAQGTIQRGELGAVSKNRPDTFYSQTQDQWLRTRGANDKERQRPVYDLKPTARVESHVEYKGAARGADQPGKGTADDYGKASVMVYDNERQTTQTRTVVSNLTSAVKAIVAPLLDVMKHGIKEYTIDAPRTFGNMSAQIPAKATVYDPVSGMMRTTIKETLIHDTTIANPRGRDAVPVNYEDATRTTGRETLPVEDTTRNMSSHTYRVVVYNPDAVARTTVRETTVGSKNPQGYVGAGVAGTEGAYTHIPVQVYATSKQFMSDNPHVGDAAGGVSDFRPVSDAAQRNAEIDGTREALNIASGHVPSAGGAYIGMASEGVDMESKKLISDVYAPRAVGNAEAQVPSGVVPILPCDLTRGDPSRPNAQEGRLDAGLLSSLKTNPYSIRINPIGA